MNGQATNAAQSYRGEEPACEQTLGGLHDEIENLAAELNAVSFRIDGHLHGLGPAPEPNVKEVKQDGLRASAERSAASLRQVLDRFHRIVNRL